MIKSKEQLKKEQTDMRTAVLFARFQAIWQGAWTQSIDQGGVSIALEEWGQAIENIPDSAIKDALAYYRTNGGDFPPSIPRFVQTCAKLGGEPSASELLEIIIRRDFENNPLAEKIFKSVSTWNWTHDKPEQLISRIKEFIDNERTQPLKGIEDASRTRAISKSRSHGMRSVKDHILSTYPMGDSG